MGEAHVAERQAATSEASRVRCPSGKAAGGSERALSGAQGMLEQKYVAYVPALDNYYAYRLQGLIVMPQLRDEIIDRLNYLAKTYTQYASANGININRSSPVLLSGRGHGDDMAEAVLKSGDQLDIIEHLPTSMSQLPTNNKSTGADVAAATDGASQTDNIAAAETQYVEVPAPQYIQHTVKSACSAITSHYNQTFEKMHVVWPMQIIDGSEVAITNEKNEVLATARLRVGNKIFIQENTGELGVGVYLTDLAYRRSAHSIAITAAATATNQCH